MSETDSEAHASASALNPSNREALIGIMWNVPHQPPRAVTRRMFDGDLSYDLGIVEFDDQGVCHYRTQMAAIADKLAEFGERDAIILVFVHGWKHDARSDDDNLAHFSGFSKRLCGGKPKDGAAGLRRLRRLARHDAYSRHILVDTLSLSQLTFWDRQEAARRVSTGSIRELLGRLRQYSNRQAKDGSRLLVARAMNRLAQRSNF